MHVSRVESDMYQYRPCSPVGITIKQTLPHPVYVTNYIYEFTFSLVHHNFRIIGRQLKISQKAQQLRLGGH